MPRLSLVRRLTYASIVCLISTHAEAKEVGARAGVGVPLDPVQAPGVVAGLSACFMSADASWPALLRVRGEVLGFLAIEGKAFLPAISADLGLRAGPLDFFLTGGMELFGVANRRSVTVFSALGFMGGAGISWRVHPRVRLEARGVTLWLPSFSTATLKAPEGDPQPTFAYLSGLLGVEFSSESSTRESDEEF
jgi:hypothetical protein